MAYSRELGATERIYLALKGVCPPMINHLCWDGTGEFDVPKWKEAVRRASEANPGSRAVIKGFNMFSRIVGTGPLPEVVEIDGSGWDGMSSENIPSALTKPLNPHRGPIAELVLVHGETLRVVVRTHHSFMDGRGSLWWAEEIFRVLNGQEPIGSDSTVTEHQLCDSFQKEGRPLAEPVYIPPTGPARGDDEGVMWIRRIYPGRYRNPMGQVAVLLAKEAWKHKEGKVRIAIPVDLRARQEGLRSTGNLTNLIYIDVNPDTTPDDFSQDVARQIKEGRDGMIYSGDRMIKYIPVWILRRISRNNINARHATGGYTVSGMITNMGRMPVFSGGGFTGTQAWGIPSPQRNMPIFVGIAYTNEYLNMIFSIPTVLGDQGRLEKLIDNVGSGLAASS
ncbi:MAG: hypothetical protein JW807_16430 [Spirochaetes bacterium]|nr:hypothetical protein [Spirochaetota bacterium]